MKRTVQHLETTAFTLKTKPAFAGCNAFGCSRSSVVECTRTYSSGRCREWGQQRVRTDISNTIAAQACQNAR